MNQRITYLLLALVFSAFTVWGCGGSSGGGMKRSSYKPYYMESEVHDKELVPVQGLYFVFMKPEAENVDPGQFETEVAGLSVRRTYGDGKLLLCDFTGDPDQLAGLQKVSKVERAYEHPKKNK